MRALPVIIAATCCGAAFGSQSYTPPEGGEAWQVSRVYLEAQPGADGAQGVVAFLCNHAETQHRVQCFARHLQPGRAYSLWVLKRKPGGGWARQTRLTPKIAPPRADDRGELRLTLSARRCPLSGNDTVGLLLEPTASDTGPPRWALLGSLRQLR